MSGVIPGAAAAAAAALAASAAVDIGSIMSGLLDLVLGPVGETGLETAPFLVGVLLIGISEWLQS